MNAATPTTLLLLSALYAACIYVDKGTTVAGVAEPSIRGAKAVRYQLFRLGL